MFSRLSTGLVALLCAVAFSASSASAQAIDPLPPEPEGFTLTPFLASSFGGSLENAPATGGIALGYGANQRISLEAEFGVAPGARQGELIVVDSSFWTLSGNVLYHFTQGNFTPYATAGIGIVSADPDLPVTGPDVLERDTTSFAWNFGAGAKAGLNERFGLRADLRYFTAGNAAPDHWRLYGGLVIRRIGM